MIARREFCAATLAGWLAAPSVALAGGLLPAQAAAPEAAASIRTIGVISAVGDRALIWRFGMPAALVSKQTYLAIDAWGLDQHVIARVQKALSGRIQVTPVAYDPAAFTPKVSDGLLHLESEPDLPRLIRAMPAGTADAYLVIAKATQQMVLYPNEVEGLGVFRVKPMLGMKPPGLTFASLRMTLLQAGTGKVLAERLVQAPMPRSPQHDSIPYVRLEEADWADTAEAMTEAQKDGLRMRLEGLLDRAVDRTLEKIGLAAPAA